MSPLLELLVCPILLLCSDKAFYAEMVSHVILASQIKIRKEYVPVGVYAIIQQARNFFRRRRLLSARWALNFLPSAKNGIDLRTRNMCVSQCVPPDTSSGSFDHFADNRRPDAKHQVDFFLKSIVKRRNIEVAAPFNDNLSPVQYRLHILSTKTSRNNNQCHIHKPR